MTARAFDHLLPHAVPVSPDLRLFLYGVRRMAAGGIGDAFAANALFVAFRLSFRRPLVLMRTLMVEISRGAAKRQAIAPCCCPRMTASEQALVQGIGAVLPDPQQAHAVLANALGVSNCLDVLQTAEAVATCFADLGRPLPSS